MDANFNVNLDLSRLRRRAAWEVEGRGTDWAAETEGDAELVGENGQTAARITGVKAWKQRGCLKIIAR